jgi:hypothetical protein
MQLLCSLQLRQMIVVVRLYVSKILHPIGPPCARKRRQPHRRAMKRWEAVKCQSSGGTCVSTECAMATTVWIVYPGMATDASICQTTVSIARSAASRFTSLQVI